MGNQNTSGIVEEEEAKNEAPDNAQGVSPPDAVTLEKQTVVQENAAEAEGDNIPPVEIQECDDKDIEDDKGSFEGSDAVMDISTNGSDSGEGRSKLSDEEQDQPCTFTDIQEEQNVLKDENLEVDDHDAKKNEEDSVLADAASLEGAFSEACTHEEEEQSDSFNAVNEAPRTSLLDSSTSQNQHKIECSALDHEEKPIIHESDQPSDQENNQFLIRCSSDLTEVIKAKFEENGEDLLEDTEKQEDNELPNQNVLEKSLHSESETSTTENIHETESETTEKCVIELQSLTKIDTQTAEAETPPTSNETEPNPSCVGDQVELRKSPSFDFGISLDTRSEESDQTPLLYQDKTARRSLSSCSNLRFPNTGVQTEYVGKPLQFQAVHVEEKTIRMERSNSESAQNSLNNKQENANTVTEDAHTNGSNASPVSRDADAISPKGNGRRKVRSSLFTTCICCTAAIS